MAAALTTVASVIIRLFLAAILFRAALHKIRNRRQFQAELQAYQLLPDAVWSLSLLPIAGFALVLVETYCALLLLDLSQTLPALFAAALLALYALAMAINLLRGRQHIDCGCGGAQGRAQTISWSLVLRNLVLILLALFCVITPASTNSMNIATLFIISAAVIVALLLYAAIAQAIANRQGYRQWTH